MTFSLLERRGPADFRHFLACPRLPGAFPQVSAPIDFHRLLDLSSPTMGWGKIGVMNAHQAGVAQKEFIILDRKRILLLKEKYHEAQPQISPDGRWMAYTSNESGQNQVYVRPFPEIEGGRWQVSTSRGDSPLWSPDGRELFSRNGDAVMAVSLKTDPTFSVETPKVLFRGTYVNTVFVYQNWDFATWDISPDGKRFLMMKETGATTSSDGGPREINIVLTWFEELKQWVPV
jgi:serine/threonine-protein kinase